MMQIVLKCLASYLLGSLMGGLIVGRLKDGVDIRTLGSGNAGGTNALRTQGKGFAFWVLLIDIGKGFIATRVIAPLGSIESPWLPALCGLAAVVGHVYPIWFGFRGGKGVATVAGALAGIAVTLLVPMLLVWLAVLVLSGYVGLGSISAAISLPVYVACSGFEPQVPLLLFGCAVAALVIFTHRANIARMWAGTEPRVHRRGFPGGGRG